MIPCILVATDGRPGAAGAIRIARHLAERDGARVEVLAVHEPVEVYSGGPRDLLTTLAPEFDADAVQILRSQVQAQLGHLGRSRADWALRVEVGPVAPTIARVAADCGARWIVLGLRASGALERWLSRETVLRIVHLAHVPVLAVSQSAAELPREIVLAVDFSEFSRHAVREMIPLAAAGARVHLVHVIPAPSLGDATRWTEWERSYRAGVERRLDELATELGLREKATVQIHILSGDPVREILRLAEEVGADLVGAGSHGAGFWTRLFLGGVATRLVHRARCSVLVAPPRGVPRELLELSEREMLASLGNAAGLLVSDPLASQATSSPPTLHSPGPPPT